MPTTTIRLEDDLKSRVVAAAESAGKTAHAFMLDAIAQTVEQVELDNAFNAVADARWTRLQATGKTVDWDEAKAYLKARAVALKGKAPGRKTVSTERPAPRKFGA